MNFKTVVASALVREAAEIIENRGLASSVAQRLFKSLAPTADDASVVHAIGQAIDGFPVNKHDSLITLRWERQTKLRWTQPELVLKEAQSALHSPALQYQAALTLQREATRLYRNGEIDGANNFLLDTAIRLKAAPVYNETHFIREDLVELLNIENKRALSSGKVTNGQYVHTISTALKPEYGLEAPAWKSGLRIVEEALEKRDFTMAEYMARNMALVPCTVGKTAETWEKVIDQAEAAGGGWQDWAKEKIAEALSAAPKESHLNMVALDMAKAEMGVGWLRRAPSQPAR